jgi:hypothetical protein
MEAWGAAEQEELFQNLLGGLGNTIRTLCHDNRLSGAGFPE